MSRNLHDCSKSQHISALLMDNWTTRGAIFLPIHTTSIQTSKITDYGEGSCLGFPSEVLGLVADIVHKNLHCQPLNLEPQMGSLFLSIAFRQSNSGVLLRLNLQIWKCGRRTGHERAPPPPPLGFWHVCVPFRG